jgi:hypothetical protein
MQAKLGQKKRRAAEHQIDAAGLRRSGHHMQATTATATTTAVAR